MASVFLLGGIFFVVHGFQDIAGDARKNRLSAGMGGSPWLGDYPWLQEGFKFSASRETIKPLATALIGTATVAPFFWVALGNPSAWAFDLFAAGLAIIPACALWRFLVVLRQALRFGSSFLTYDTFPFFIGNAVSAQLRVGKNSQLIQSLTLTLRCVQEKYVTTGGGQRWGVGRGTTSTECYELFSQVMVIDQDLRKNSSAAIPMRFSIPADLPATGLSMRPPTYWEIEARGATPGGEYKALFLVPVYRA